MTTHHIQSLAVRSIPITLLCLAMLVRTAWIRDDDVFEFGQGIHWWCQLKISFLHIRSRISLYEPGHSPFGNPTFRIFHGILQMQPTLVERAEKHDFGIIEMSTGYIGIVRTHRTYWLNLPAAPLLMLTVSLVAPIVWLRRYLGERRNTERRHSDQCGYDLRVHQPGERCPECGTTVPRPAAGC